VVIKLKGAVGAMVSPEDVTPEPPEDQLASAPPPPQAINKLAVANNSRTLEYARPGTPQSASSVVRAYAMSYSRAAEFPIELRFMQSS